MQTGISQCNHLPYLIYIAQVLEEPNIKKMEDKTIYNFPTAVED